MNFFSWHVSLHEFFWGFFPTPSPPHHFSNGPSLIGLQQGEYRRMQREQLWLTESGCFGYSHQKIEAKIPFFFCSKIINLSFNGLAKITTQLAKYPHVLYAKPSNKVYIMLFVCHPKILHKHCFQFVLGVKMAPRETENNAYAKFWDDKQRALWYVMVFSAVVNTVSVIVMQIRVMGS